MYDGAILFVAFLISFTLGILIAWGIETLIKRKKAHRRYLRRLQTENQRLKSVVNLYELELQYKGSKR